MVIKNFHWLEKGFRASENPVQTALDLIRLCPNTSLAKEKLPFGPIQTDVDGISLSTW